MKRVLIVKMTSLGDVCHTLPAVTDAKNALKNVQFDWVVEAPFADIVRMHQGVDEIIESQLRQWRKANWLKFIKQLRAKRYDLIIDAQGLLKSALVASLAKGTRVGLDKQSAREPLASLFYHEKTAIGKSQHAVDRVRQLFATALDYTCPQTPPDYGLSINTQNSQNAIVFLHGTTWKTKHWPQIPW